MKEADYFSAIGFFRLNMVGVAGLKPTASWSRTRKQRNILVQPIKIYRITMRFTTNDLQQMIFNK